MWLLVTVRDVEGGVFRETSQTPRSVIVRPSHPVGIDEPGLILIPRAAK